MFEVTFPGGVAVDVAIDGQTIHTNQDGSAPTPFQLFLASLATCAGFYALRFCQERQIATAGLGVAMEVEREPLRIRLVVTPPPQFPEKYRDALVRAVDHCAVKRAIAEPARFEVTVA
jgi:ribosomal protein S12 methylthiotransferase accessory factor